MQNSLEYYCIWHGLIRKNNFCLLLDNCNYPCEKSRGIEKTYLRYTFFSLHLYNTISWENGHTSRHIYITISAFTSVHPCMHVWLASCISQPWLFYCFHSSRYLIWLLPHLECEEKSLQIILLLLSVNGFLPRINRFLVVIGNDYPTAIRHGCFPISSLQPGILNKILMYIS